VRARDPGTSARDTPGSGAVRGAGRDIGLRAPASAVPRGTGRGTATGDAQGTLRRDSSHDAGFYTGITPLPRHDPEKPGIVDRRGGEGGRGSPDGPFRCRCGTTAWRPLSQVGSGVGVGSRRHGDAPSSAAGPRVERGRGSGSSRQRETGPVDARGKPLRDGATTGGSDRRDEALGMSLGAGSAPPLLPGHPSSPRGGGLRRGRAQQGLPPPSPELGPPGIIRWRIGASVGEIGAKYSESEALIPLARGKCASKERASPRRAFEQRMGEPSVLGTPDRSRGGGQVTTSESFAASQPRPPPRPPARGTTRAPTLLPRSNPKRGGRGRPRRGPRPGRPQRPPPLPRRPPRAGTTAAPHRRRRWATRT